MRLHSPWVAKIAGRSCGAGFWLLFRTLLKDVQTTEEANPYDATGSQRYLYSVWHDSAVLAAFGGRHTRTVALTSRHRDGSFVAGVVGSIGVGSVRGSSGRNGGAAARRLLEVAESHDIIITPDGPRGPRRTMSRGIVYLASRTGNPIVPTAFACQNAWEVPGSWTTQTVPKPFSKVVLLAGAPIHIPNDIAKQRTEQHLHSVQLAMDALQIRANDELIGPKSTTPAVPTPRTNPRVPVSVLGSSE